jgi:predicted dehydrogenase
MGEDLRRFEGPYVHVHDAVTTGRIGDVSVFNYLVANSPREDWPAWRTQVEWCAGGVLIDVGYLAVDLVAWILDAPITWVFASESGFLAPGVEHSVVMSVGFLNARQSEETVANLCLTYQTVPGSVQEELSVFGRNGSVFTRRFQAERSPAPPTVIEHLTGSQARHPVFSPPDASAPLVDFVDSIRMRREARSSGRSHLRTVQLVEAGYRSIRERRRIQL